MFPAPFEPKTLFGFLQGSFHPPLLLSWRLLSEAAVNSPFPGQVHSYKTLPILRLHLSTVRTIEESPWYSDCLEIQLQSIEIITLYLGPTRLLINNTMSTTYPTTQHPISSHPTVYPTTYPIVFFYIYYSKTHSPNLTQPTEPPRPQTPKKMLSLHSKCPKSLKRKGKKQAKPTEPPNRPKAPPKPSQSNQTKHPHLPPPRKEHTKTT